MSRAQRRWCVGMMMAMAAVLGWGRYAGWLPESMPGHGGTDLSRYHERHCRVVYVVDGDTLDVDIPDSRHGKDRTRVRLWGVDTPETKHPELGERPFGREAYAFTRELVLNQRVRLVLEPLEEARDRYGRLLAYVYVDEERMLNEALLEAGLAFADERFEHIYRSRFLELQKRAQRAGAGLWREPDPEGWPEWYRRRHEAGYETAR